MASSRALAEIDDDLGEAPAGAGDGRRGVGHRLRAEAGDVGAGAGEGHGDRPAEAACARR